MVFDIRRYSIHDGPGIRTAIFLKGCPLHCKWCHNPEGISKKPEIIFREQRCKFCETCVENCSSNAIVTLDKGKVIDPIKCNLCGDCVSVCPSEALELVGRIMSTQEVIDEILKDTIFYDESGGGVTFSGGEPLLQYEFLHDLLI